MRLSTLKLKELIIFAALGAIMFISHIAMMGLPNIHFIGLFIAAYTLTYRAKALIPLYIYVMLYGAFYGILSMLPYLYIWLPLWGVFMLAGRLRLPLKVKVPLYMVLSALHGLSFGTLYAPFSALVFGFSFSFETMLAWIAAGFLFDITHAIGNFAAGALIVPLSELLKKLDAQVKQGNGSSVSNAEKH